ncbi:hypothetical protein ACA910_016250 [Epithemia clementina (nom. ined.)]
MIGIDLIPHPPIYLSEVRPMDIWLLLAVGMGWEFLSRLVLLSFKVKPKWLLKKEIGLELLQRETKRMRDLGPSKFVETSKLERQVLAKEREVEEIRTQRKKKEEQVDKYLIRYGNYGVMFLIFILYYGVPILSLDVTTTTSDEIPDDLSAVAAGPTFRTIFFPISYFGLGMRIARWGLADASNTIGALVVMWSGQVFAEKLMDGLFALMLQ